MTRMQEPNALCITLSVSSLGTMIKTALSIATEVAVVHDRAEISTNYSYVNYARLLRAA